MSELLRIGRSVCGRGHLPDPALFRRKDSRSDLGGIDMKIEAETLTPDPMTIVFHLFVLAPFLVISACSTAPMTEEEIYARETARNELEDEYLMKQMACDDIGGVMVFNYQTMHRKKRKLTAAQMKSAHCVRSTKNLGGSVY